MKINFNKHRVDKSLILDVENCFNKAVDYLKIPCKDLEVNVAVVNKMKIKKINSQYRNINKVTDVLSFPFLLKEGVSGEQVVAGKITKENFLQDVDPDTGNIILGDLYVCFSKVKNQAKEYGTGIRREFVYLCLHGLLHLVGFDHIEENDKKHMRKVEEEIMNLL